MKKGNIRTVKCSAYSLQVLNVPVPSDATTKHEATLLQTFTAALFGRYCCGSEETVTVLKH